VLSAVVIHDVPQVLRIRPPIAREQDWVVRARERPSRLAASKGGYPLHTMIERAGGAAGAAGCGGDRGKDSVRQAIRAVGSRDVVTDHAALAGGGSPT